MTQENGGINSADAKNGTENANANVGSQDDTKTQIDELKAQLETLKKESSGKDRKIAEFLKLQEQNELNAKTEKEQLEAYRLKAELYERKEAFRQSFKEVGLNPDEFEAIIDEKDAKTQADLFAKLLKAKTDASVQSALEAFKKQELEKKGGIPNLKTSTKDNPNVGINDAIRGALGRN